MFYRCQTSVLKANFRRFSASTLQNYWIMSLTGICRIWLDGEKVNQPFDYTRDTLNSCSTLVLTPLVYGIFSTLHSEFEGLFLECWIWFMSNMSYVLMLNKLICPKFVIPENPAYFLSMSSIRNLILAFLGVFLVLFCFVLILKICTFMWTVVRSPKPSFVFWRSLLASCSLHSS